MPPPSPAEPLHVGDPAGHPERGEGARTLSPISRNSAPDTSRGNTTHHWIHGFRSTSSGVGWYSADRAPHRAAPDRDAVERVFLAGHELLEQRGMRGVGRYGRQPLLELARVLHAERVACAPAPAGGLTTSGKPTAAANSRHSAALPHSRCRAHGTPAERSTSFMRDLSRKFRAAPAPSPSMPNASRTSASGTCSSSSVPINRSTGPSFRHPAHRPRQLRGDRGVADPEVGCEVRAQFVRHLLLGLVRDQPEAHAGQLGRGGHEPERRGQQERCDERGVHHGR